MTFDLSIGYFRISLLNKIVVTCALSFFFSTLISSNQAVGEEGDIKKQIQELRQQMQQMQQKLEELEKKNMELESRAKKAEEEKKSEEEIKQITQAPLPREGFFQRALQTLNPDISIIGTFAGAWFNEDDPTVFAEADPQNTGVNLQEIEIGFQSVVDPYFRFDSFISLQKEGIEVEEAYATTLFSLPLASQFRGGIMRAKFGRINLIHREFQNFVTLPIVAAEFLGEHLNPPQIELNIAPAFIPWYMELTAAGGSADVETASFAQDGNDLGKLLYNFHIANFFEITENLSVNLGGSYATGVNATGPDESTNLFGLDLFAKYRPLRNNPYQEVMFQTEWMWRNAQTPEEKLKDYGFYAELVYRFLQRWNTGFRFGLTDTKTPIPFEPGNGGNGEIEELLKPEGMFSLASSGEEGEEEEEAMLGLFGRTYRISPMLTFNPSEFSRIRLQYDYTNFDFKENEHAIYLQFQYSLGPHGAHPF
ncbi:MAG TPA: hypothetical protein VGA95_14440 [Thermodesulfobacteriota bacterium]